MEGWKDGAKQGSGDGRVRLRGGRWESRVIESESPGPWVVGVFSGHVPLPSGGVSGLPVGGHCCPRAGQDMGGGHTLRTRKIPSSIAASTMALSSSSSAVRSPEIVRRISGAASSSIVLSPAWGQKRLSDDPLAQKERPLASRGLAHSQSLQWGSGSGPPSLSRSFHVPGRRAATRPCSGLWDSLNPRGPRGVFSRPHG